MITDPKPYSAYKASGVPWLGGIPEHWDSRPGFSQLAEKNVRNVGTLETQVLSLSYGRIVIKPPEKLHGLVPESFETYQIVDPGDIIIRSTDLQNDWTSLRVGIVRDRGIITSAYLCMRAKGELTSEYAFQLLHAFDLIKVFYGLGSGLRQNLSFADFKRLPLLVPPVDEQGAIVRYLDYMDRSIRRHIRAKQKLIKLLDEQRQAIIQRAVTRGLEAHVRRKPSGLRWVGEVPETWEVNRAKWSYREVDERSETGEEELLSVSHITGVTPRAQKNITMFMAESYVGHKVCRQGDLVINTMWAWMGALGVAHQTGIVSPAYAVYRPLKPDLFAPEFIEMLLRSNGYVGEFVCRSTGIQSSRLRLYPEEFFRVPLVRPPIDEQRAILASIRDHTAELDQAKATALREVALLGEFRSRLVADVVTGKLDVREVAASLPGEIGQEELVLDEMDPFAEEGLDGDDSVLGGSFEEVEA